MAAQLFERAGSVYLGVRLFPTFFEMMMNANRKTLILPSVLISVGTGWLLTTLGIAPGIDWIWTLGLAVSGILTFVVLGCDKVTFVGGSFLVITSCLSLLRQTGRISLDVEIPILVIVAGVLMLIARLPSIPKPHWATQP